MQNYAVYAGSFDPITKGHLWVIKESIKLFDQVIVAIGVNSAKRSKFDIPTRCSLIKESLVEEGFSEPDRNRIHITSFENQFLIHYAKSMKCTHLIRGIRTESDFEYEREMMHINLEIDPNIQTIFLMPPKEVGSISSSMVKGFVGPDGWEKIASKYVSNCVLEKLKNSNEQA